MHDTNGCQLRGSACTRDRPGGLAALGLSDGRHPEQRACSGRLHSLRFNGLLAGHHRQLRASGCSERY